MKRQTDRFEKNVVREMLAVDQSLIRKLRTLPDGREETKSRGRERHCQFWSEFPVKFGVIGGYGRRDIS